MRSRFLSLFIFLIIGLTFSSCDNLLDRPEIILSEDRLEFSKDGGSAIVDFNILNPVDGQNIELTSASNWITDLKLVENTVVFHVEENLTDEAREAILSFYYKGAREVKELIVVQSKGDLEITVNGVSFPMVFIEGGTFNMGATPEHGDEIMDYERPVHQVTLSDYYIGKYQVTQELWMAVMGENPSRYTRSDQNPVEMIRWADAKEFTKRLSDATGRRFVMPTEAQWEFAARGGNLSHGYLYSGSNDIKEVAWYGNNYETHPVGLKKPNELGIYDMSGNVYEWCHDWFSYYSEGSQTDPSGPGTAIKDQEWHIFRGGSYSHIPNYCRVCYRDAYVEEAAVSNVGFRLAMLP